MDKKFILVLIITFIIHSGSLFVPFMGDEITGLIHNPVIIDLGTFYKQMMSFKGFFQRPLSVFSFAIDYYFFGLSPFAFHMTNLIIHLFNVCLVYIIAKKLNLPYLITTLIFATHPLTTACVSQVYGRPYSLGTFFMCIGILLFINDNLKSITNKFWMVLIWILMFLSKQVFIYFPAILAAFSLIRKFRPEFKLTYHTTIPLIIFSVLLASGTFLVHIEPNLRNTDISSTTFLISQFANFPFILLTLYIVPINISLIHDYKLYNDFFSSIYPLTGFLLFSLILIYAIKKRTSLEGVLVFCFLISIIPTNSIVPKTEIVLEWRLYPSLIFFCFYIGLKFKDVIKYASRYKLLKETLYAMFGFYILMNVYLIINQNKIYQDYVKTYKQVLVNYPESSIAHNNLGYYYLVNEHYQKAEKHLLQSHNLSPKYKRPMSNLSLLYFKMGNLKKSQEYSEKLNQNKF